MVGTSIDYPLHKPDKMNSRLFTGQKGGSSDSLHLHFSQHRILHRIVCQMTCVKDDEFDETMNLIFIQAFSNIKAYASIEYKYWPLSPSF